MYEQYFPNDVRYNSNTVVESDNLSIISAINMPKPSLSAFGYVIQDILYLKNSFTYVIFSFSRRSANQVTHTLARAYDSLSDLTVWYAAPNDYVNSFVLADLI